MRHIAFTQRMWIVDLNFIGHEIVPIIKYLLTFRSTLLPLFSGSKSLGSSFTMNMASYSGRPVFILQVCTDADQAVASRSLYWQL